MTNLVHFTPIAATTAAEKLSEFIKMCRDELTVFGADLNWANWKWRQAGVNFSKISAGRRTEFADPLDDTFIDFAKAYFRYQHGHQPTKGRHELKALRSIEAALLQVKRNANISGLDISVLDEAARIGRSYYGPSSAYACGQQLERLARFVTEKRLTGSSFGTWKSPIKKASDENIRTGPKAQAARDKKLPSEEAQRALAEIFANDPQDTRSIFATSTFAMSMCAPSRITEILELPSDCEVDDTDTKGLSRYGWRFFAGKGYEGDIKWIPTVMVPIAKEAVRRIRALTEEPRRLARWIEDNPTRFYRHANCPDVADDVSLSTKQAANALGLASLTGTGLSKRKGAHTLNSLWQYVMSRQPKKPLKEFPWLSKQKGIKYSNALFCMTHHLLYHRRGASPVVLWAPEGGTFNNTLRTGRSLKSVFDLHGYLSADGQHLKLTSHQARHLLNTIANRGGLSQDQIAKWSGRVNSRENRIYNNMSEFEMVAAAEAVDTSLSLYGPQGEITQHIPITRQEFSLMERGPVHVTEFGVCVHDYVMSPCEKFRDCINCDEQLCVKGDGERLKRIKMRLAEVEKDSVQAKDAQADSVSGADRWEEHHEKTRTRLLQLVEILESPHVPDGSQIKLSGGNDYSHLRRAIRARTADALERATRDASSLSEMKRLLGG